MSCACSPYRVCSMCIHSENVSRDFRDFDYPGPVDTGEPEEEPEEEPEDPEEDPEEEPSEDL